MAHLERVSGYLVRIQKRTYSVCEAPPLSDELDLLARQYLARLEARGFSARTRVIRTRGLGLFLRFLATRRRTTPVAIRPQDVEEFCAAALARLILRGPRKGQTLHPNTLATWLSGVRGFCRFLVRTGRLLLDPSVGLPSLVIPRTLPRVLTPREVHRLLAGAAGLTPVDMRDRAILELLYSSGLRLSEMVALDLVDIDFAGREVHVRHGKGGTNRRVPLGGAAARALLAYLKDGRELLMGDRSVRSTTAIFLSRRGTRLSGLLLGRMVRRRAHLAGLPGRVTPHTLRHTVAVHLLKGGADVRYVQLFLGHVSVGTVVLYTRLVLTDLKETLIRCHPRRRLLI